jgi:IPT/TIG domain-containing protein/PKD domain-containing protein
MDRVPMRAGSTQRRSGLPAVTARSATRGRRLSPVALGMVALLAVIALGVGASSAAAVIVHLKNRSTLSYQPLRTTRPIGFKPLDEVFSNLDYNGGPVMSSNTNYAFYWRPVGASAYPAGYQTGVDQYFEDLAHDSGGTQNVESISSQYNDASGQFARYDSHFGAAILDTDPYPANGCARAAVCLTDAQLRAELLSYTATHGYPRDLAHEYFMLTPPGVEDCFEAAAHECSAGTSRGTYCAYHGNVSLGAEELVYANDPYVTGNSGCDDGNHPNGAPSDGVLEGGLSHEHNESITDPEPNSAWTDVAGSGGEVGDKCRLFEEADEYGTPLGTAPDGAKYNQLINGHRYWYQQEWSNQTDQCLQRLSFAGEEPTASFTATPGAGNSASFDAAASTAPAGVAQYNWQFNDGPGLSTPTETTTPTVSHTFPKSGSYVVALTIFAGDGTSIGTARTFTVGKAPAPSVSGLSPKDGPASGGTTVTILGTGFADATAVSFGASPAASFTVSSPSSITAVSPPAAKGRLDVTVSSPEGTSAVNKHDRFKYKKR